MQGERERRIDEILRAAQARPPAERAEFLAAECMGDDQLRREAEARLNADDSGPLGAAKPAAITTGTELGPYRIESKLGKGGMGEVFRAVDTRLGRQVAVKVCSGVFAGRFAREARAIAALNHPHICTLHDVGGDYLVMELIEGETLAERLRHGPLPIEVTLRYGSQVADALAAAHARGIVHRDLKPGNIMITQSGVKVLDFGLARTAADETVTAANHILGTPAYMAPEQREGRECDARTDIYALGLVLLEMATGKRATPDALPAKPLRFAHIVRRCLAVNPDERWQSARDLKLELDWAAQPDEAPAVPRFRHRYALVGAAALALVLMARIATKVPLRNPSRGGAVSRLAIPLPERAVTANPPGVFGPPAISPDGRTLVIGLGEGSDRHLWRRRLDAGTFERMAGTEGGNYAFWSPDGSQIGFFANGKLKKIPAGGGDTQTLCEYTVRAERGGSWNASGTIIYGVNYAGLFRVSDRGGEPVRVAGLDAKLGENSLRHPRFLPDGKHFLCFSRTNNLENRGVYLYSLDQPGRKRLGLSDQEIDVARDPGTGREYLLFSKAGKLWAQELDSGRGELRGTPIAIDQDAGLFSASDTGTVVFRRTDIEQGIYTWFDRGGRELVRVGSPVDSWDVELSPDDRYAAFNNHRSLDGHFSIWLIDTARGAAFPFSVQTERSFAPIWSHEGSRVFFQSDRASTSQVFVKAVDEAGLEQPFAPAAGIFRLQDVSADGRILLALKGVDRAHSRLVYRAPGKEDWVPLLGGGSSENRGQFSPDGRFVAYESDESGAWETYVVDFPAARRKQRVSMAGGQEARWTQNGKEIVYYATEGALTSLGFANSAVATEAKRLFPIRFSSNIDGFHYAVSHDGQRILAMKETGRERSRDLHIILNWPRLLEVGGSGAP